MSQSILLPHDGSTYSSSIVEALAPLVGDGASVTLLHVDEGMPGATEELDSTEEKLRALGAVVSRKTVPSDDPAAVIVDEAGDECPDLVALSTHGQSGEHKRIRGGVAERVLRSCAAPVFMANPTAERSDRLRSVLVPLEPNSASAQILDTLLPLLAGKDARLTFLFVDFDDPTDTEAKRAKRRAERAQDIEEWFSEPIERARAAGITASVRVAHGNPWTEILTLSDAGEYDLLAMTTHARAGVSRWVFGSVVERVLRSCRLPLLIQRLRPE